ncbi:hypothetical protein FEM03_21940 [Phragmitibacter flavus]|uniref:Uncharacterized protein n=2 Tax=Phragmitibacter flavus TaxID=2576071 RepID=A0A5R8K8E5_9BACT|nr:hypothetical protein FEM03_21940 [Phragmitibacter flavus]
MSVSSLFFRGAIGALLVQAVSLVSAEARPGDRTPSSVVRLDAAAHQLVESYERSLSSHRHKHTSSRSEMRFLQAAKNLESSAHSLRVNVDAERGSRRAQEDVAMLRRSYSSLSDALSNVRLSERVRNDFYTVRSLVKQVDQERDRIYAAASPRRGHDRHDHDHDHRHDDRKKDDRPRLPGVLGRIFGN